MSTNGNGTQEQSALEPIGYQAEEVSTEDYAFLESPADEAPKVLGLKAEFFVLRPKSASRLADIDFSREPDATDVWEEFNIIRSSDPFWEGGPADNFAARYTGALNVAESGSYTFYLTSDDGSALYIDGQRVINNDGTHGTRERAVTLQLDAGSHDIQILYFERGGAQSLRFEWAGPDTGGVRGLVNGSALSHDASLDADSAVEYPGDEPAPAPDEPVNETPGGEVPVSEAPENQTPIIDPDGDATQPDPVEDPDQADEASKVLGLKAEFFVLKPWSVSVLADIDFSREPDATDVWEEFNIIRSSDPFWEGGPADNFAARYTGALNVAESGSYTFYLTSDDGSALYIDGQRVIDNDGAHATQERAVTLQLDAGSHDIQILYFERGGDQSLRFEWAGPDTGGVRGLVSGSTLSHDASLDADSAVEYPGDEPAPAPDEPVNETPGGEVPVSEAPENQTPIIDPDGDATQPDPVEDPDQADEASKVLGLKAEFFVLKPWSVSVLADIDFSREPDATDVWEEFNIIRSSDPFWEGGPADNFAARYTGALNVAESGSYTFYLTSDDGSALYIDGQRVIDNDGAHATQERAVTLQLDAGSHDIQILYFERGGDQSLRLEWAGPDTGGVRGLVNGPALSHDAPADPVNEAPENDGPHDHDGSHDQDGSHDHGDEDHQGSPTSPRTDEEIEAYVQAVKSEEDHHGHHAHPDSTQMATEHQQLLNLVPRSEATHVAIGNGEWFDASTWYQGRIPDAGAKVLIPRGVEVNYNGESDASLFSIRVDGTLQFATDRDTKLVLDTMVVAPSGRLEIGSAERPIEAGVNARIVIADNGDIDVNWDPTLLSRGVLSHGSVEIYGAEKTAFEKVAVAPMRGDTSLHLSEAPTGWQVGDTLVVTGTHKTKLGTASQDEVLEIVSIDGNKITFDRPLAYDHDTPREDLFAYVANTTRNVTFESESGAESAVHHRGHVMFMHNDDVDVRYAAFDHLGRTDKSTPAFDVGALDTISSDSNVKGRYSFHFHKTGTEDQENPAIALGNTVTGSIGWGFVHHSSHADFIDNVAYDVFGAAYAAEDGDETGTWLRNMAINVTGVGWGDWTVKRGEDTARHDNGRSGEGFFFAGRLVEATENVAANTTHGYVWMTRSAPTSALSDSLHHPTIAYGRETLRPDQAAIQGFRDNEAFGTEVGLMVVKASSIQNHDFRTIMDGFLNWETLQGANLSYTGQYTLKNFDLVGSSESYANKYHGTGMVIGNNTRDVVVNEFKVEGFNTGVYFTGNSQSHFLIDGGLSGNLRDYVGYDPATHIELSKDELISGRLSYEPNPSVTASGRDAILSGTIEDSIGAYERFPVKLHWWHQVSPLIAENGYYSTSDGRNVILIPDLISDRATGEILVLTQVVTLNMTHQQIQNDYRIKLLGGAEYNGVIDLEGQKPDVNDDFMTTFVNQGVILDVLANDSDPDGGILRVAEAADPRNGNVFIGDDGKILYQPNHGFTGVDNFSYWAVDDTGLYSKAMVSVEVWDL